MSQKTDENIAISHVTHESNNTSQKDTHETQTDAPPQRRTLHHLKRAAIQFLALAWLAPVITLLVLNFQGYIAGASIGCGVTTCSVSEWGLNVTQLVNDYDTRDRNVVGAFQLVAKVIEIWFVFAAGRLVYDLAMLLARNGDGLPLRYYTTNVEFADLRIILTPSFWTSVLRHPRDPTVLNTDSRRRLLVAFAVIVAIVSGVANLMGPAVAVLLLPTLGWRDLPLPQKTTVFGGLAASESPRSAIVNSFSCEPSRLEDGDYTCLGTGSNTDLDALLVDTSVLPQMTAASQNSLLNQAFLTFSFNLSDSLVLGDPVGQ
jgi:hypothetical protein